MNYTSGEQYKPVFKFNGAAIKVRKSFFIAPLVLWVGISWISSKYLPQSSIFRRALIGFAGMFIALSADVGHALAHTYSAKVAKAPMDEILLGLDMPRTIYYDNAVEPRQHVIRALGGPIYNALYLVISIVWRSKSPTGSPRRFLAEIACVVNGILFVGSLLPIPGVDGGTIRKWCQVNRKKVVL
jgi:Zn-dependent protease